MMKGMRLYGHMHRQSNEAMYGDNAEIKSRNGMKDQLGKISLGESILAPIIKGYQIGGMALALILVGTALLLTAVAADPGLISNVCASVGALIIFSTLVRLYFVDLKKAQKFKESIKDNEELLNSIQDTAIQMTELSSHLQSLAFKHADK